ncbi:APC family permease [Bombilactobacillus thymidiniphilus]|uniref:APC family permease n=1 Tax=Bombilactobacillus thymidiniphilus TaxID=2923363 RepID=A0ABY4PBE0_9LACO|nr:APC family permease [Bombilactobacillus thymidiniphilus]UQS83074.1 APC family permease [Bombilactobacillus thymidiniphilus]
MHKQQLGFGSIILLGLNAIIGSGIFLLPNQVARLMGTASLLVIGFDAVLVISIALCFAQAATYFHQDGGPYLYAKSAFGGFVGFEVGFITWVICIIAQATMTAAFETELVTIFPAMHPFKALIASAIIIILAMINLTGVQASKITINVVTISKLLPLILFIAIGIFFIRGQNFVPFFPHGHYQKGSFAPAAITMFYAFTGFEGMVLAAGDMKDATHNLPKAITLVISCVALIYALIQITTTGILGQQLAHNNVPIQAAFQKITGPVGNDIVAAGTLLSTGGLMVTSSFITPRAGVALGEGGSLPRWFAKRNQANAPWVTIIISLSLTLILVWSGSFKFLVQISAISRFAQYLPTCLAVLVFAHTKKLSPKQFHLKGGPIIPLLAIGVSLWLLIQVKWQQLILGLGALIVAIPIYGFMHWRKIDHAKHY